MSLDKDLLDHLRSGTTTLCRCWRVKRADGIVLGFTDHDLSLTFDGTTFRPDEGLSARNLEQTTGLAVDNSEAVGILSSAGISEVDILAGRFDGATIEAWLVNWRNASQRHPLFVGEVGEIRRSGGAFTAELRGLTEALNQPQGRIYQTPCAAILGDTACGVDLSRRDLSVEAEIQRLRGGIVVELERLAAYAPRWFERGTLRVLTGSAAGDARVIKNDILTGSGRKIDLWESIRGSLRTGDRVRLTAGCDKSLSCCREKFSNTVNFQGFPHLPGEDFLMAYPRSGDGERGDR
ncbi:DUF2163 domain-containing protein [Palleronia sp. LCG004]|uniref:DUF2163 domain-containing protein n=1 Tax=Palleronia sp. LCG004 TaxID=3079304 RepID=UPI00294312BA|nr:DUF2163 domain-containing protein [Palleronia sp. LCG004]WOI55006.1 DUF2163 domain-containing protein [Palleronia sp. LCG004]